MNISRHYFIVFLVALVTLLSTESYARHCQGPPDINGHRGSLPHGQCGNTGLHNNSGTTACGNTNSGSTCCPGTGDLPYVVGWGHSCEIPAGAMHSSDKTCITTPNLIGEIIDTITTLGIAIDMRANFCSVGQGGDTSLEGALISKTYLDQCNSGTKRQQKACKNSLLRGIDPNGHHLTSSSPYITNNLTQNLCEAMPNLDRPVYDSSGNFVFYNNKQAFCPMRRCNIPTDTMLSKYYDRMAPRAEIMAAFTAGIGGAISYFTGDCVDVQELGNGQTRGVGMWDIVQLKGEIEGDQICTKMLFTTGYTTLACKARSIPKTYYAETKNCYLRNSACVTGELKSKGFFPFTAQMMECVNDLVTNMFNTPADLGCSQNPLSAFQDSLKDIVRVMMILYVILFGLRIVMGGTIPHKSEMFIFILKFALVLHFAVGTVPGPNQKTGIQQVYDLGMTAMSSFSNMIAGNDALGHNPDGTPIMSSNLCQYNTSTYDEGYEYLALWDSLDCKLAYYLSIASPLKGGGLAATHGQFVHIGLFVLIWGAFFSFSLPLVVFLFAFGILMLSIVIYVVHVYILALIAISLSIFMGPIFIPMALFEKTKGYFDEWLKLVISYTLYPAIIMAFVGIMVSTFDQTIFPDCNFNLVPYGSMSYWEIFNPSDTCKDSYGYMMGVLTAGSASEVMDFADGLFKFYRLKSGNYMLEKLLSSLMFSTFFAFLFYHFAKQLSAFAADVSQSTNIGGMAIKPTAVADAAIKVSKWKGKKGKKSGAGKGKGISVSGKDGNNSKRSGINVSGKSDRKKNE